MDFWERLFARAGRRKPEPSAEAKCAEEWDTELASELSETEREHLKKAGCIRKHIYFSGRVQAVGFRYSALCLAKELQLTGWVKNLTDGRVEAELQGQAKLVDSFVERISQRGSCRATDRGRRRCSARNRIGRNGVGEALRCT